MKIIDKQSELADALIADPMHIAVCLLRINRFNGQHPTSNVLMHSMDVAHRVAHHGQRVELWAMLHDAHEILSGDVNRLWKHEDIEAKQLRVDLHLRERLAIPMTAEELRLVRNADIESGNDEYHYGCKMKYPMSTSRACIRFQSVVMDWVYLEVPK